MKITGCRVNYGPVAKKELFELLPRSIERMISGNVDQSFDFKIELPIGGRVTSAVKSFGPDFEGTDDFNMLKGQILPVVGNRRVVAFGIKFNGDGTITVVSTEEIPSNEGALPRQSTVDQLNKIRRATKSVTIDDSIPKMKGANLGYEGNTIDRGIESYEDFQKNNKSFIPSQNLKHLKSPFKKTFESKFYSKEILPSEAIEALSYYVNSDTKIEVYPDPKVEGTYAVRVYREDLTFDLLWCKGGFDEISSDENEYGFSTWPPKSGELKFF